MQTAASVSADYDRLYSVARFCYSEVEPMLRSMPLSRESQIRIVEVLSQRLENSGLDYAISKDFVAETVRCRDTKLVERWVGSASNAAWLMVHEDLAHFFAKFAIRRWNPEIYVLHHVPKTGGTSVQSLLNKNSFFVWYPQTYHQEMWDISGLLGFASQMLEFETYTRRDRIYISGHFNLPTMIAELGLKGRSKGVILARAPLAMISSAARYIWTKVEQRDVELTAQYALLDPDRLQTLRQSLTSPDATDAYASVGDLIRGIVAQPQFQENYHEILVRYFYNEDVLDPIGLSHFLRECGELFPCVDIGRDKELVCQCLGIEGPLPEENTSVLSHRDLVRALGGEDALRHLIAPRQWSSSEVFGVLCAHRAGYNVEPGGFAGRAAAHPEPRIDLKLSKASPPRD